MISDLVAEFRQLEKALETLVEHLQSSRPKHWIPLSELEESSDSKQLDIACDLISDLWYRHQGDGRETRSRHGIILADEHCQTLIQDVNQQKQRFREQVTREKEDRSKWRLKYEALSEQPSSLRDKLMNAGLKRIHLKQCFRLIPLLEKAPSKIGFSWYCNGRSIKSLSLKQAETLLLELGEAKPHIQIQLQKLGQLPPGTRLARVQNQAPVVRANLVFHPGALPQRKAMNLAMPLFVPAHSDPQQHPLPEHNQISSEAPEGRTRQARGDQRIEDEAYLPSIRAYLYK